MVTEILGILIVVGTVMVLLLRHFMAKREADREREARVKQQEVGAAAVELRCALERAADGIIERMGERVDHLEQLIAEAERRETALRDRIRELEAREAEIPETSFEYALAKEMDERKMPELPAHVESIEMADAEIVQKEARGAEAAHEANPMSPEQSMPEEEMTALSPMQPDGESLSSAVEEELQHEAHHTREDESLPAEMLEDAQRETWQEDVLVLPPSDGADEQAQLLSSLEAMQTKVQSPRELAAALLRDGTDVEEVARVTGMGRGALELMQRMQAK